MLQNQIKLMRELSRLEHTEHNILTLLSCFRGHMIYSSADVVLPTLIALWGMVVYFWAAAMVAVDSAFAHCSSDSEESAHCAWDNCWHNVPLHHI